MARFRKSAEDASILCYVPKGEFIHASMPSKALLLEVRKLGINIRKSPPDSKDLLVSWDDDSLCAEVTEVLFKPETKENWMQIVPKEGSGR